MRWRYRLNDQDRIWFVLRDGRVYDRLVQLMPAGNTSLRERSDGKNWVENSGCDNRLSRLMAAISFVFRGTGAFKWVLWR
jgi:hypothetical protein